MISGHVTAAGEAMIRLSIEGHGGAAIEIEAVIDTGYDGELTLPSAAVTALTLTWRRRGRSILADGSSTTFDVYAADVVWDGVGRPVVVDEPTQLRLWACDCCPDTS